MASLAAPDASTYLPFASLSSRTSAALIVLAVWHLMLGSYLAIAGRRYWRVTCAICAGLAAEWVACAILLNIVGPQGLNPSLSYSANDLCLMATILSAFLVFAIFSLLLPVRWYIGWWPGYFALGLLGGASIGVTVLILHGNHLLIESEARWALIGALAILGALMVIVTRFWGALACCSLIAAWLLALGIDLFVNTGSGAAYGLRILLDRQSSHRASLDVPGYQPPLSTQLIFGLSWALALILIGAQWLVWRDRPFLRPPTTGKALEIKRKSHEGVGGRLRDGILSVLLCSRQRQRNSDSSWPDSTDREMLQTQHSMTAGNLNDASDLSSPRAPFLSTEFANHVRDRSGATGRLSVPSTARSPSLSGSTSTEAPTERDLRRLTADYSRALAALEAGQLARGDSMLSTRQDTNNSSRQPSYSHLPQHDLSNVRQDGIHSRTSDGAIVPFYYKANETPVHPALAQRNQDSSPRRPLPILPPAVLAERRDSDARIGGFVDPTAKKNVSHAALADSQPRVFTIEPEEYLQDDDHNARSQPNDSYLSMRSPAERRLSGQHQQPGRLLAPRLPQRHDSDRGTTYSVPLTNITHSEYAEREQFRPPSWTGDLPWNPSMLRGPLDPRTLPSHPEDTPPADIRRPLQLPHDANPPAQEVVHVRHYSVPQADAVPVPMQALQPAGLLVSDTYDSRPCEDPKADEPYLTPPERSRKLTKLATPTSSFGSLPSPRSLGGGRSKIPRTSRTTARDASLFPDDDDLPDEAEQSSAESHSQSYHGPVPSGFDHRGGSFDEHARSQSWSNSSHTAHPAAFAVVPPEMRSDDSLRPDRRYNVHPLHPENKASFEAQLPIRDLPIPQRPGVVHRHSLPVSNKASIVGTPDESPGEGSNPLDRIKKVAEGGSTPGDGPDSIHEQANMDVAAAVAAGLVPPAPKSPNAVAQALTRTASQPAGEVVPQPTPTSRPERSKVRFFDAVTGRSNSNTANAVSAPRTKSFRDRMRRSASTSNTNT